MLTPEQQEIRRTGIGGSELAAVAGMSKYAGAHHVWLCKKGLAHEIEDTHHVQRGRFLEPGILDWYAYREQRQVLNPGTLRHPESSVILATPDGLAMHGNNSSPPVALEVKCPSLPFEWGRDWTDDIPKRHIPQVMAECAVLEVEQAHVIAFHSGDIHIHPISFNADLFDALRVIAERFWRDFVVADREPPMDYHETTSKWLGERFPDVMGEMIVANEEQDELARDLFSIRQQMKSLKERLATLVNTFKRQIGENEGIRSRDNDWRMTWRKTKKGSRRFVPWQSKAA